MKTEGELETDNARTLIGLTAYAPYNRSYLEPHKLNLEIHLRRVEGNSFGGLDFRLVFQIPDDLIE